MDGKKFRNMRTPFWYFVEGLIHLAVGLAEVLSLGFFHPDWYGDFSGWRLLHMFDIVE